MHDPQNPPASSSPAIPPGPAVPAVLEARDLNFGYPGNPLFTQWSADIFPGVTLLQGGDGRGKTTLLRLLAGAVPAASGMLQIHAVPLHEQPDHYRQQVFWTEARSDAFDPLTPPAYFESLRGRWPALAGGTLEQHIDGLGLAPHLHKQLFMLSTGSKRKVFLAAALASGAPVVLIDEPFAALDVPSIAYLTQFLRQAAAARTQAIVIADYAAPAGVELSGNIDLGD